MKGFLKRDLCHIWLNIKFYLVFIIALILLAVFTEMGTSFVNLYLLIFAASSLVGLFNYDEANHWWGYAATVPNGRSGMVAARYLLALALAVIVGLLQLVLGLLTQEGSYLLAPAYTGGILFYCAILMPLCYYFGTRGRFVFIGILVLTGAAAGLATSTVAFIEGAPVGGPWNNVIAGLLPWLLLAALLAFAASYLISRRVMARKEF